MMPLLETACNAHASSSTAFLKIDVQNFPGIVSEHSVKGIPTFLALKKGEPVGMVAGADSRKLADLVERHSKPASLPDSSKPKSSGDEHVKLKQEEESLKKKLLAIQNEQKKLKGNSDSHTIDRSAAHSIRRRSYSYTRPGYGGRGYWIYVDDY